MPQPEKDLERPSSTRLEARFPYYDLRVKTRSPSPFAWRPDFLAALVATRYIYQMWASAAAELPAPQRPRVIAMTANALPSDREACLTAGMDDYISKPVYLEELRAALERSGTGPFAQAARLERDSTPKVNPATLTEVIARPSGRETIEVYLEEAQGLLAKLRTAVEAGDAQGVDAA